MGVKAVRQEYLLQEKPDTSDMMTVNGVGQVHQS